MFPILGALPASIISYWLLAIIVMQMITYCQSALSLVINRISSDYMSNVKPIMEAVVAVARESDARMTMVSGIATSTTKWRV